MTSAIFSLLSITGIAVLPSLVWLFFYLKEDLHPEPKSWIFIVFLLGVSVSPLVIFLESMLKNLLAYFSFSFPAFLTTFSPTFYLVILIAPIIEELAKYGVVHLALNRNLVLDEPIDGMVYLIISALGFAAIENVVAIFAFVNIEDVGFVFSTINLASLRFFSAVALHALSSGIVGYFFAKYYFSKKKKVHFIFQGLVFAVILHGLYNFLIIQRGVYPGAFFLAGLLLGIAGALVLWLFHDLKHKEVDGELEALEAAGS